VQKANSGHPGMAIGSAPTAYTLWQKHYKNNPANPVWDNRDRFILSAGHASMLMYSLLHLYGFGTTLDDIKDFRQLGSKTPGHPEHGLTAGVETTTGPLGMGVGNAVGMAAAEAHLAAIFNRPGFDIVDHNTFALCGDGCLMEGVASEACSLAGTLKLGKLVLIYDRNQITIDGSTNLAFREDVAKRFEAYGWSVFTVEDGNTDLDSIDKAIAAAKADTERPSIVIVNTRIGYGCAPVEGTSKCHGNPLGVEGVKILKETLGMPAEAFVIDDSVYAHTAEMAAKNAKAEAEWNEMFARYEAEYPELAAQYKSFMAGIPEGLFTDDMYEFDGGMATRAASGTVLNRLAAKLPQLFGGSADLAPANNSFMKEREEFSAENYAGSNVHFGVREFAMAAMANGMALHGGIAPYVATFFVFSDYMKHGIRLSALMEQQVLYILTHDSIGVGEDGATHEPIEHLAALRAMPGAYMWRPADPKETAAAYEFAFSVKAPTCVALSRQNLPLYENSGREALKGAYILKKEKGEKADAILIGTGSEVALCMDAAEALAAEGIDVRVVSMPCMELFEEQCCEYKKSVLPCDITARLAVEAGSAFGWGKYVGFEGDTLTLDRFGASAPQDKLFKALGFTVENVVAKVKALVK